MNKRYDSYTLVRVTAGRHKERVGRVAFYGVSRFDVKQPMACIKTDDGIEPDWCWVRPEQVTEMSREEIRELYTAKHNFRGVSEAFRGDHRVASGDGDKGGCGPH